MVPSHQLQPSPAIKILTGLSGPTVTKYTQIPTERFNGLQSKSYQRGRSKHPGQTHRSCARNSSSHVPSYSCRPPSKLRHVDPSGYIQKWSTTPSPISTRRESYRVHHPAGPSSLSSNEQWPRFTRGAGGEISHRWTRGPSNLFQERITHWQIQLPSVLDQMLALLSVAVVKTYDANHDRPATSRSHGYTAPVLASSAQPVVTRLPMRRLPYCSTHGPDRGHKSAFCEPPPPRRPS